MEIQNIIRRLASIIAKVYHDKYVEELCDKDPDIDMLRMEK